MNGTTNPATCQPTLSDLAKMECLTLTPDDVARFIGCNPHTLRIMASTPDGRQGLGFPVIRLGTDTKIIRIPFLRFMGWEGRINGATEEAYTA